MVGLDVSKTRSSVVCTGREMECNGLVSCYRHAKLRRKRVEDEKKEREKEKEREK